ncbi:MAG: glycosyltransferase family 4 protein [Gammaproteobacteria bacterium]
MDRYKMAWGAVLGNALMNRPDAAAQASKASAERGLGPVMAGKDSGWIDNEMKGSLGRLLFVVSEDWYFCSHRLPVARAARDAGFEVYVATRVHEHRKCIEQEGFQVLPIKMRRGSFNPIMEVASVMELTRLYRKIRPHIVHHVALKPVLQGGVALRLAGVPVSANAIAGLGHVFSSRGVRAQVLKFAVGRALKILLSRPGTAVIAQNPDDVEVLRRDVGLATTSIVLVRGSGVDTEHFRPGTRDAGIPTITMVSRMLWAKGVGVLAEAAAILRKRGVAVRVVLVGAPDPENPGSVPAEVLQQWHADGLLDWRGKCSAVEEIWRASDIAVLPSHYGEGVPKSLLEAAACGLPIITTDMPGCREVVTNGQNGLLIAPRDPVGLADAMEKLASDPALCQQMGKASRLRAEAEYSERLVQEATLKVYERLLSGIALR